VHLYKKNSTGRYIAQTAIVKVRIGIVEKRLGMNKFVRTKSSTESKFSKILLSSCMQD